jgi:nucleoside-diphosphate kinase
MDYTLAILKPDCVKRKLIGEAIRFIESSGFDIVALKMMRLDQTSAKTFYHVHREKPFFSSLLKFMTSGPCIPILLHKKNAVEEFRHVIGATNPSDAAPGTLRQQFGSNVQENIVHGSDSDLNAKKEIAFFFPVSEITV